MTVIADTTGTSSMLLPAKGAGAADELYGLDLNDVLIGTHPLNAGVSILGTGSNLDPVTDITTADIVSSDNDLLEGGSGSDALFGVDGNDVLYGGDGDDIGLILVGGNFFRAGLYGGAGDDFLDGGRGTDELQGGSGADRLYGGEGDDALKGGGGSDILDGGIGSDVLAGGDGADVLFGRDGSDELRGQAGKDTLAGGLGADKFVFELKSDSIKGAATRDVIADFSHKQADKIDLHLIDANETKAGDQAFKFIATAAFHHIKGELHEIELVNKTLVEGDTNGDGKADFQIEVTGHLHLVKGDYIL